MKSKFVLATALLVAAAVVPPPAAADSLKVHARRAQRADDGYGVPARGMSMAQVERRFGAPLEKLPTAGGDAPRHPPINRWRYAGYTVYFERNRVIHSVADTAATTPQR